WPRCKTVSPGGFERPMADDFRVLLSDSLAMQGIEILKRNPRIAVDLKPGLKPAELAGIIGGYHALVIRSSTTVTREIIDRADALKVIGRAGVGVDNVDLEAATRRGIVVMNSPQGNSVTTAEHTLSMMMALARHIPAANAALRAGKWERGRFIGVEVCNKTLGIIGLGNIGRIVADRAQGLKMKVIGFDPILTGEAAMRLGIELVGLDDLFRRSDFITVHAPLTEETRGLVNAAAFATMKKGVRIINCARGGIVDENALREALASGKCAGAALDVFVEEPPAHDHPLLALDNVIATPHLGAATDEAQLQVAVDIASQVVEFLLDGTVRNSVNIPALSVRELEALGPHLRLGEKLGQLIAQLIDTAPSQVTVGFAGEAADLKAEPIVASVLKGLLSGFLDQHLNYVNAPYIARERGITVAETRSRETTDYINTLTVSVRTANGVHEAAGAVVGNRALRLIRIDGYPIEAAPDGYFLMLLNRDVPGVVGAVGTMLGQAGVNIAGLELGRDRAGGMALSLVEIDGPPPAATIEQLKTIPAITAASLIKL
ncbi:MAG TPA: phosphoglycerate dehydrogenase, partial [Candidatus Binataceae bacterium]|nr:phosphoglycerate dehydrogenase [Candidatus Binataceae bacterium]